MREQIIEILKDIKPGIDYEKQTDLIENHILESLEIMQLVSELSEEFDINITLYYIKPQNFKSVDTICKMVERIQDEE